MHPFHRAGLGEPPFELLDHQRRSHARCKMCGTLIRNVFIVRSADGRTSEVGSSCVLRARHMEPAMRAVLRNQIIDRRSEAEIERITWAERLLAKDTNLGRLAELDPPDRWRHERGATAGDWALWMLEHSGKPGKMRVVRFLEEKLGARSS